MNLTRALNEFAQFCIGKCHVAAGHSDQERKMARDAVIAAMKGRVRVERGVFFREPCSSFQRRFHCRSVPCAVDLEYLTGIDGLSKGDCALDVVTYELATKAGGDFSFICPLEASERSSFEFLQG
eukprot:324722-Rhodomonas_salina.1